MFSGPFGHPSLSVFAGFSILLVLIALLVGNLVGRRSTRSGHASESSIGSAVAAVLGLLAFMLAFTFNSAAERYTERKALLLDEVNAIGTSYLRADLLPPAERRQVRALLAEYVNVRDFDPKNVPDYNERIARSTAIQQQLWQVTRNLSDAGYEGVRLGKFLDALNEVIDFHTSRDFVGGRYRIPTPIWGALFAVTALAMFAIGFQLGTGRKGSPQVAIALALAYSVVILLIADLDRSYEGMLVVDQTPMQELNTQLQASEREALKTSVHES